MVNPKIIIKIKQPPTINNIFSKLKPLLLSMLFELTSKLLSSKSKINTYFSKIYTQTHPPTHTHALAYIKTHKNTYFQHFAYIYFIVYFYIFCTVFLFYASNTLSTIGLFFFFFYLCFFLCAFFLNLARYFVSVCIIFLLFFFSFFF